MKQKWVKCGVALVLSICIMSPTLAINNNFKINSQVINPVCVWILVNRSADSGYSASSTTPQLLAYFKQPKSQSINDIINLSACQASETNGKVSKNGKLVNYDFPWGLNNNFDNDRRRGSFAYEYIGQSKSGIDVLVTHDFGGGTGQLNAIMLVKRIAMSYYKLNAKKQWTSVPFTSLALLAVIPGGDRNVGSFKTVNIVGNTLTGTRYSEKNQINDHSHPDEKFTLPLPG